MKKLWNILLILVGIGSLLLIAFTIFVATALGKRGGTSEYNSNEQLISEKQNLKSELILTDTIPQGKMTYELYFAEFGGRMENLPVEIQIDGNKIIVYNSEKNPLTGGKIIIQGILLKHKSGKWIIGETETDRNAEEIGGCSSGPTPIDFETKIIEWC
ncbi:hypothetical protein [Xanthomarina sp. F2636L]|uniref:hypothetical protein n=1 Tax=Xanthomarina sp. F2636L TaxID=2996018 RepID=UPI00225DF4A7|nr:hypothetical protein [Xanthomarina sp. F2636L]MCX7552232.1 hypothetical protein [Xanthomarina sp. F2636L]